MTADKVTTVVAEPGPQMISHSLTTPGIVVFGLACVFLAKGAYDYVAGVALGLLAFARFTLVEAPFRQIQDRAAL